MSETLTWPDWLADLPDRERLREIMAAVHRCFMECPGTEKTGPHMTTVMAEHFIAQMLAAKP